MSKSKAYNYSGLEHIITYSNWLLAKNTNVNQVTTWQIVNVWTQLRSTVCDHTIVWQFITVGQQKNVRQHDNVNVNCRSRVATVSEYWIILLFGTLKETRRKYEPYWLMFTLTLASRRLAHASVSLANRSSLFRVLYNIDFYRWNAIFCWKDISRITRQIFNLSNNVSDVLIAPPSKKPIINKCEVQRCS